MLHEQILLRTGISKSISFHCQTPVIYFVEACAFLTIEVNGNVFWSTKKSLSNGYTKELQ